jgi:hypothetical protein
MRHQRAGNIALLQADSFAVSHAWLQEAAPGVIKMLHDRAGAECAAGHPTDDVSVCC